MSRIGGRGIEKRLASAKVVKLKRKEHPYAIKAKPGPGTREKSVALGFILRDLLQLGNTLKEIKKILNDQKVQVNGIVRTDFRLPVGLFDVVAIPEIKKIYRMVLDSKARLGVEEISAASGKEKLCKIINKRMVRGKKLEITTSDGRTFSINNGKEYVVGSTLKISLPEQKILKTIALEAGKHAYVVTGKHAGKKVKILEVTEGTEKKEKLVTLQDDKHSIETVAGNVIAIE